MARDRQRAKRRQRRAAQNPASAPAKPERTKPLHRDNVPGELDHASGQVDQFEAALVAGGEGVASDEPAEAELEPGVEPEADVEPGVEPEADAEDLYDADEAVAPDEAVDEGDLGSGAGDVAAAPAARAGAPAKRSGSSVVNFLRASWAELQRVQWPDRRQVGQATAVVLGFVVIAGAFLGLADALAQEVVNIIL